MPEKKIYGSPDELRKKYNGNITYTDSNASEAYVTVWTDRQREY